MNEYDADKATGDATEKLTEAARGSHEAAARSAAAMQSQNARLARSFYEGSVEALEAQAEFNRHTLQSLAELSLKHQEAFLRLSRESFDAYDGFLDSLGAYYKKVVEEPEDR